MAREVRVNIVGDASRLERTLARADGRLDHFGKSARRMSGILAGALAGGTAVRGVGAIVKTYADYDTALRDVGAVAQVSGKRLDALGEISRKAGLQTGVGATAATQAMGELAKAGLSAAEVGPALKGTLALAQAGGLGAADAASAAANSMQTFGLRAADTAKIADTFANAANLTTADVGDFAIAMSQGGAAAKIAGLSFEDTSLVLTELARIGIKGSDAGTSLKTAFMQLAAPTDKAAETMKKYGLSFFDANGRVREAGDISEMLRSKLGKLTNEQQIQVLKTLAGTDGFRTLAAMMKVSGAESDVLAGKLTKQGSAAETARAKQAGFAGSMNRLKAAGQELGISLGERFAPKIAKFADRLTGLANDPAFKDGLVDKFEDLEHGAGELWETVRPGVELVGRLGSAFAGLPPDVQRSVVQMAALAAVARRLSGITGFGGAASGIARMRGEMAQVPAAARRAEVATAAATRPAAAVPGRAAPARAGTPAAVTMVPAGMLGVTGPSALEMRSLSKGDIDTRALSAQREQAAASRRAVQARRALATAEVAEATAARAAIGARAVPRTAATRGVVAAAEAQLAAARATTASARESAVAASAESVAARKRLASARAVQTMATSTGPAAAAVVAPSRAQRMSGALQTGVGAVGGFARRNVKTGAIGAVAGVAGAALSGGSVATSALSGAAMGSMAGPVGAAAGAVVAAGTTALVNHFKGAGAKRTEAAAKAYAAQVTGATDKAMETGLRAAPARRVAKANTTLAQGQRAVADYRAGQRELNSGEAGSMGRGLKLQESAKDRAKAAGLDIDALLKGTSNAYKKAGREAAAAFIAGQKGIKLGTAGGLLADFDAQLGKAPRAAQIAGATAMVRLAQSLERSGAAPKGTADRLIRALARKYDGLEPQVGKAGAASSAALNRALGDQRSVQSAGRLTGRIVDKFRGLGDMPRIAVRSTAGAVAVMRTQLDRLRQIADNKSLPKAMREQAAAELPGLRKQYNATLTRMARDMGMSRAEAKDWATKVAAAARKAGGGSVDVDTLKDSVRDLSDTMLTSKQSARILSRAFQDLGLDAKTARQRAQEALDVPAPAPLPFSGPSLDPDQYGPSFPTAKKPTKKQSRRTGGLIRRFQDGGLVPAYVSPGEEITFAGQSMVVPGNRVAADTVPMMLPVGAAVWTDHGQALRAAGVPDAQALADQMPHFREGGPVQRFKAGGKPKKKARAANVGFSVYDDPPPGAFGALTNGYAELGTARRTDGRATGYGWLAKALGLKGELPPNTPLTVRIGGHQKTLRKRDRGYGQGGNGVRSDSRYALDIWKDNWGTFGLNRNSKGTATVALGSDVKGLKAGAKSGSLALRSHTVTRTTDDVHRITAAGAARNMPLYRAPITDVSSVFDQARSGTYDAAARAALLNETIRAGRVNVTTTTSTVSGRAATAAAKAAAKGGKLPTKSSVIDQARGLRSPNLMGANPGMGVYGRLGKVFGLGISSGRRAAGGRTSSGGISQHGSGSALDQSGPASNMLRYARWLASSGVAKMADQVIHTPLGYGFSGGKKVGLGFFGSAVNRDHHDHVHVGDRTPPRFRRGGVVRRFAAGGRVGSDPRVARDTGRAIGGKSAAALRSLYGAEVRDTTTVTNALTALQNLLSNARSATAKRLEELAHQLDIGIRRTVAKKSPGGAVITRGEAAQIRRSRSALSLVQTELLDRAGSVAGKSDRIASKDAQRQTEFAVRQRIKGVETSSAAGLADQAGQYDRQLAKGGTLDRQRAALETARRLAEKAGPSGRAAAKALKEEIQTADNTRQDVRASRAEARRQLPWQQADERIAKFDFNDAMAALTPGGADDRASLLGRQAEAQEALNKALAAGNQEQATKYATALKGVNDSLASLPTHAQVAATKLADESGARLGHFDYLDAKAALTADTGDDREYLLGRKAELERDVTAAEAIGGADGEAAATPFLQALKGVNDALGSLDTTLQEQQEATQSLSDLLKQTAENQQKILAGQAVGSPELARALWAVASGGIGSSVVRASGTPSYAGSGARL